VIEQYKNDVRLEDLLSHQERTSVHVSRVSLFSGTLDEATQLAMRDKDVYTIGRFISFRGNPFTRTTVEFLVQFSDGSERWLPWSQELFQTKPYEDLCITDPMLTPLLHTKTEADRIMREINATPISEVQPGLTVYVDLRWESHTWYKQLPLPNLFTTKYVMAMKYGTFVGKKKLKIHIFNALFNSAHVVDHVFVRWYGSLTSINTIGPNPCVLVDRKFCQLHPAILEGWHP
jgi:hypothetical protein